MCLFEIFFPQFCENESRMICRVSQIVSTVGGHYGQNGQTLHENGKISIFGSKQWEACGGDKPIFRLEWGGVGGGDQKHHLN